LGFLWQESHPEKIPEKEFQAVGEVIQMSQMVKKLDNPPNRIRERRMAFIVPGTGKPMTLPQLAARMGESVKPHTIGRFETGERVIDLPWLQRIARALDCSVGELLNAEDNPGAPRNYDEQAVLEAMRIDERAAESIARVAEAQRAYRADGIDDEPIAPRKRA
jgi:transcriptional regulator with XRE-family HTH domain